MIAEIRRNPMNRFLLKALITKLEGEIAVAKANVKVYINNSTGIGEHPDLVEAIETQIEIIANAEEKVDIINKHFFDGAKA
tara:strand:- start:309 stop:551 length:243 start_codon:yes stop_codon:yes gene_type:complete